MRYLLDEYSSSFTGLILFSSILVAAGIALYQDPVVRRWVDDSRRRIAMALRQLGDEIDLDEHFNSNQNQTRDQEERQEDETTLRRRRRESLVRRNRNELIRKAREEGIAVDLDELAAISRETEDQARSRAGLPPQSPARTDRSKSFDQLVGSDGTLLADTSSSSAAAGAEEGLRHRGTAAKGMASGSAFANPFADENVLFDQDEMRDDAKPERLNNPARDLDMDKSLRPHRIEDYQMQLMLLEQQNKKRLWVARQEQDNDNSPAAQQVKQKLEAELALMVQEAENRSQAAPQAQAAADPQREGMGDDYEEQLRALEEQNRERIMAFHAQSPSAIPAPLVVASVSPQPEMVTLSSAPSVTASFHSAPSSPSTLSSANHSVHSFIPDDNDAPTPTGTMTPELMDFEDGFSTAASIVGSNADDIGEVDLLSDTGFSQVSGTQTPSSWTDVESDVGMSEDEGVQGPGHVHQ